MEDSPPSSWNDRSRSDGIVLVSGAGGTVVESYARPDLFITDAERADVFGGRQKGRGTALDI
jgi:hypothetical protein